MTLDPRTITAFKELQHSPVREWLQARQSEIEKESRHMEGAGCYRRQGMSLFIDEFIQHITDADKNMLDLKRQQHSAELNKRANSF